MSHHYLPFARMAMLNALTLLATVAPVVARERREPLPPPGSSPEMIVPNAVCGPCIRYVNGPCCDACVPLVRRELSVCDPCTGCPICVPVCLPACCDGEPCVSGRNTIFGNGLVRFDWCCGHGIVIRFMRCGDLKVVYY